MASDGFYCICNQPYDPSKFMIQCDICKEWFHGSCIGIFEHQSTDIDKYHCPQCSATYGPSITKLRTNWHRHDHTDPNPHGKAVQTGTPFFIRELKSRHFPSPDGVLVHLLGRQVSQSYFIQSGFSKPILVDCIDGLDIILPPSTFTVFDVMNLIGEDYEIDVIDVNRQTDLKMSMKEWVTYLSSPVRNKVFNVISLEFSKTKMSQYIEPPLSVREISWVHNLWPEILPPECPYQRPNVHKYCLMGVSDSFTDFHVDFGGTSVWYHILKGEKVFYMIKPTPANLSLYERWMASSNQMETFFGDLVDACYKMTVREGQTFFIPTGWIHAVLTTSDSLVFGGNFLHSMNIPLQLQIYEMEKRIKTPEKFSFPMFQTTNWYAAKQIYEQIKEYNEENLPCPEYILLGAKALSSTVKSWTQEKDFVKRLDEIPDTVNYSRLLKDLAKEIRHVEKINNASKPKVEREKRKSRRIRHVNSEETDQKKQVAPLKLSISNHAENELKVSIKSKPESLPTTLVKSVDEKVSPLRLSVLQNPQSNQFIHEGTSEIENVYLKNHKMEGQYITKDTSIFDFVDSDDGTSNLVVDEKPSKSPKTKSKTPKQRKKVDQKNSKTAAKEKKPLKLKLSLNCKPVEEESLPNKSEIDERLGSPLHNGTIDDILKASAYSNNNTSLPPVSSIHKALLPGLPPAFQQPAANKFNPSNLTNAASKSPKIPTTHLPPISDIKKHLTMSPSNSEMQNENSRSNDHLGGRASPSTREAIQGMLSIGSSAFEFNSPMDTSSYVPGAVLPGLNTLPNSSELVPSKSHTARFVTSVSPARPHSKPVRNKTATFRDRRQLSKSKLYMDDDDFEEKMSKCPQDEEYVYPGLEFSDDDEDIVQKINHRRGDPKDSTWNPRAKVTFSCPKGERPIREGHKKEPIESGLAAAAAKLAHLPPAKRPYNRKKQAQSLKHKDDDPEAGTSATALKRQNSADLIMKNSKKPKKGFATAKQRLGKILKIHKMLH